MTQHYSIEIPNPKATTYKVVTLIIAIINALSFAFVYLKSEQGIGILLMGAVLASGSLILYAIRNNTKNATVFNIEIIFGICAIIWFITGNYWLGLPLLLFGLIGMIVPKKPMIILNEEAIQYPSLTGAKWPWKTIEWVILKDGILTVEKKDNHLLQITLDQNIAAHINEAAFNKFCAGCLHKLGEETNRHASGVNSV
ncbi:MAG: hypothetical protein WD135_03520 [Ferruginibacter sp.]